MDASLHRPGELDALTAGAATMPVPRRGRYLFLGGGSVTTEYYLPALRAMGRLAEASVIDPDARAIAQSFPQFGEAEFSDLGYETVLDALGTPDDAAACKVIVALPNAMHVAAVRAALERSCHVLCEKPLALTTADCAQLWALAAAKQRQLKIGMSRRYLPSLMLARDIVTAKEFGDVRSIEVHDCAPFLWRPRSFAFFSPASGGVLADMGVHYLDYLDTLVGALSPVSYSDDAKGGVESRVDYRLAAGDVSVGIRLSRIDQSGAYLKIRCARGDILVEKARENEVIVTPKVSPSRRISLDNPFDDPAWPKEFHGSFCQMLTDFDRAVGGEATRIADAADAERATGLIEWAYRQRAEHAVPAQARSAQRKILVTGGTGFIGCHLVDRFSSDCDIRVTARTPGRCANVSRFPIQLAPTDLLDPASVRAAVDGAQFVYHLAYGNDGRDPAKITIEGTKNIVEAAIAARAECVVVLSTMYVFGFPSGKGAVDESFPYRPYGGEYGRSKAEMERWCLARARSSLPTRIVVLNPTCVFGPGGGAYSALPADLARLGQFCWINGGTGLCNFNYVENLIDAIEAATEITAAHGQRFIISDGAVSWREFLEPMVRPFATASIPSYTASELKKLPRHGAPFRLADLVGAIASAPAVRNAAKRSGALRALAAATRGLRSSAAITIPDAAPHTGGSEVAAPSFPPPWLAELYSPAQVSFSAAKADKILGWRPAVDLQSAMRDTVDWLIESRGLPEADGCQSWNDKS